MGKKKMPTPAHFQSGDWKHIDAPETMMRDENAAGGMLDFEEIAGDDYDSFMASLGGGKVFVKSELEDQGLLGEDMAELMKEKKKKNKKKKKVADAQDAENPNSKPREAKRKRSSVSDDIVESKEASGAQKPSRKKKERALPSTRPGTAAEQAEEESDDCSAPQCTSQADVGDSDEVDMRAWSPFGLHALLLRALAKMGFTQPTAIQQATLPISIRNYNDVIGAAQTGSGKTLSFGLPILHHLLDRPSPRPLNGPAALIMSPTRELALQVCAHIATAAQFCDLQVVAIVGGMSVDKQLRLLSRKPDIVVGTPGRLWELITEGNEFLRELGHLRFLVIDEADRMLTAGHFQELTNIIDVVTSQSRALSKSLSKADKNSLRRQTFVYSATLTQTSAQKALNRVEVNQDRNLAALMKKIPFLRQPHTIDLSTRTRVVGSLVETRIECVVKDKDAYCYYLLLRNKGRSIVFVNSIALVRRLVALLTVLRVNVSPLHSSLQQRQRLKHLDRFTAGTAPVLVATDVAARGLDIKGVELVIHYQVPRDSDAYVHRSGRTARAEASGESVLLVAPEELGTYRKICHSLHKQDGVPHHEVEQEYMKQVRARIAAARQVDKVLNEQNKHHAEDNWFIRNAEAMDIELDDDLLHSRGGEEEGLAKKNVDSNVKRLKAELDRLLAQPLVPKGVSTRYITAGLRPTREVMDSVSAHAATALPLPARKKRKRTPAQLTEGKKNSRQ